MIFFFFITTAVTAQNIQIWNSDFILRAFSQPETNEIASQIQALYKLEHYGFLRRYFEFVGSGQTSVTMEDVEHSFSKLLNDTINPGPYLNAELNAMSEFFYFLDYDQTEMDYEDFKKGFQKRY